MRIQLYINGEGSSHKYPPTCCEATGRIWSVDKPDITLLISHFSALKFSKKNEHCAFEYFSLLLFMLKTVHETCAAHYQMLKLKLRSWAIWCKLQCIWMCHASMLVVMVVIGVTRMTNARHMAIVTCNKYASIEWNLLWIWKFSISAVITLSLR